MSILNDPIEIERIEKLRESNDKLDDFFADKRESWSKLIDPLFQTIKIEFTTSNSNKIIEMQSYALSYRQKINEEISFFLNRRSLVDSKIKKIKHEKFIFYATGFGLKTNLGEKGILIEAHIAENIRNIELIENHVEFLRSCNKNLEALQFSIKNIIELFNYLNK